MDSPELTIVTITRDDLGGLKKTFASLRGQSDQAVEHLVIDGASSDGSAAWATANSVFSRTVVVSEPDQGIYDAMNKGLSMASGELICFLNSGDRFASDDVVDSVLGNYRADRWQWAYGKGMLVDAAGRPARRDREPVYSWLRHAFWHSEIDHSSVFMRTSLARSLGGFDTRFAIAGDYHLLMRAGRRSQPVVMPKLLAVNLAGGVSHRRPIRTHFEMHRARKEALGLGWFLSGLDQLWTMVLISRACAALVVRRVLRPVRTRF